MVERPQFLCMETRTYPKGLLRKIIQEDLELNLETFMDLYFDFKTEYILLACLDGMETLTWKLSKLKGRIGLNLSIILSN